MDVYTQKTCHLALPTASFLSLSLSLPHLHFLGYTVHFFHPLLFFFIGFLSFIFLGRVGVTNDIALTKRFPHRRFTLSVYHHSAGDISSAEEEEEESRKKSFFLVITKHNRFLWSGI